MASYHYPLPNREDWQKLREKYKVKQGAVSGVSLGPAFEAAYSTFAMKTMSKHLVALRKLIKAIETYAAKVPDAKLRADMERVLLPRAKKHEVEVADTVKRIGDWDAYCKDLVKALGDPKLRTLPAKKAGIPLLAEKVRVSVQTFAQYSPGLDKYSKPLEQIRDETAAFQEITTQENLGKYATAVKGIHGSVKSKIG